MGKQKIAYKKIIFENLDKDHLFIYVLNIYN